MSFDWRHPTDFCHKKVMPFKGDSEDEGRWILYSIFSGSWKFISIKIWNARFTIVLVLLLSNRDSIYCFYSVMNVGLLFTEAQAGSTLTALCFEITEKNLVNTSSHNNKKGGNWKFKFFHIKTMNHWKSNVIFNDLHPLIHLYQNGRI